MAEIPTLLPPKLHHPRNSACHQCKGDCHIPESRVVVLLVTDGNAFQELRRRIAIGERLVCWYILAQKSTQRLPTVLDAPL